MKASAGRIGNARSRIGRRDDPCSSLGISGDFDGAGDRQILSTPWGGNAAGPEEAVPDCVDFLGLSECCGWSWGLDLNVWLRVLIGDDKDGDVPGVGSGAAEFEKGTGRNSHKGTPGLMEGRQGSGEGRAKTPAYNPDGQPASE
ncbi:MAG: hypothetical protein RL215_228 [Planctomycetota bacterium]